MNLIKIISEAKKGKKQIVHCRKGQKENVALNMLAIASGIPSIKMKVGVIKSEEWPKLTKAALTLANLKIFIDERGIPQ